MRVKSIVMIGVGTLVLAACAQKEEDMASMPPPPPPPGAIVGTMAADQNGDGIVDGYFTADGVYHAFAAPMPPCPPPPPPPTSTGERG